MAFLAPQIPQSLTCTQELGAASSSAAIAAFLLEKLPACSHQRLQLGSITVVGNVVSSVEMRQKVILCGSPAPQGKQCPNGVSGSLSLTSEQTPGLYERLWYQGSIRHPSRVLEVRWGP